MDRFKIGDLIVHSLHKGKTYKVLHVTQKSYLIASSDSDLESLLNKDNAKHYELKPTTVTISRKDLADAWNYMAERRATNLPTYDKSICFDMLAMKLGL